MSIKHYVLLLFFILSAGLYAQIYVAPDGDDTNAGTIDKPLKTPQKAITKMTSGGTILIRGGIYNLTTQVKSNTAGTAANYCKFWAYPGETPIFDFTGLNDRGVYISKDYWHVRGIEVRFAGSNGICISSCGFNIIEGCVTHDNGLEGTKLTGSAHDNLVINCDSYRNYDAKNHGEDADGFAAKSGVGTGNVFKGCRAWLNSDDGWDFYGCPNKVTIDSCFAFRNGINVWGDGAWAGDGNAFKLGGAGDTASHIVMNSVAFDNAAKGFDQNYNTAGLTVLNGTAYRNAKDNFSFYQTPASGHKHVMKNNIAYLGGPNLDATTVQECNSWQIWPVAAADFISLDTSLVLAPRKTDYSLPDNGFLRLEAGSGMIDAGVYVGIPFLGKAPDLGAFEYKGPTDILNGQLSKSGEGFSLGQNFPNPFNPSTVISFNLPYQDNITLSITDLQGRVVNTQNYGKFSAGQHQIQFNAVNLPSGVYLYTIHTSRQSLSHKMLLVK